MPLRRGLLVLAAAIGLAVGFVLGALSAAGSRPSWASSRPLDALSPAALPPVDETAAYRVVIGDVIPGGGDEIVVGVTLVSGDGQVLVFQRTGSGWEPAARVEGFSAIDRVEVRAVAGLGAAELLVYDEHDELTGAFYRHRGLTVLKWRPGVSGVASGDARGAFVPVWSGTLFEEAYSLDPPMEEREVRAAEVRFGRGELHVVGQRTRSRRTGEGEYRDLEASPLDARFRWDEGSFRFVPEEPGQPQAG